MSTSVRGNRETPLLGSVKMMCEVMPTISEDTALSQRGSQSSASDPDSHFEQLMVNMLDERDRLLDTLRETQESLSLAQQHLQDVIYDRDSLQRQLSSALPQVRRRAGSSFCWWLEAPPTFRTRGGSGMFPKRLNISWSFCCNLRLILCQIGGRGRAGLAPRMGLCSRG